MICFVRFLSLFACITAALTFWQPDALAQEDASVEMARQRFREGVDFYDQREYEKARLAFLQAYALKPHPSVLLNLAQSELRAGHSADAANHFALFLRENPEPDRPETQEAELGFAAAKSKAGAIVVRVDTDGADIFVDGTKKGESPLLDPLFVEPGEHTIEARLGAESQSQTVRARKAQQETVTLALAATAAPGMGESDFMDPDAPTTPPGGNGGLDSGSAGGRQAFFPWLFDHPPAVVAAAVSVVGLGSGITFAVLAKQEYDKANEFKRDLLALGDADGVGVVERGAEDEEVDEGPCELRQSTINRLGDDRVALYEEGCNRFHQAADTGDRNKAVAAASFVVAGAAAAGTLIYYFVDTSKNKENARSRSQFRARVQPITGPGVRGLSVVGQF